MDPKLFDEITKARFEHCINLLCSKGEEYSRNNDRLYNFKVAARMAGNTKFEALYGMWLKHIVSIQDMIFDAANGSLPSQKLIDDKLSDNINYSVLFEALIVEGNDEDS